MDKVSLFTPRHDDPTDDEVRHILQYLDRKESMKSYNRLHRQCIRYWRASTMLDRSSVTFHRNGNVVHKYTALTRAYVTLIEDQERHKLLVLASHHGCHLSKLPNAEIQRTGAKETA
jgi:hypothetical protein